ncbi:VOC family protein [uncultured Cohaesibacter sp.]|uniref:VOC family protein n=1 Tax=uncultured Cohaesibacter sp. TaxID=1002546 RepID=UPI0029C6E831|nr:VOC family protein [uncultured Cohaesibacter sp.]
MIDHLSISVSDLDVSARFYEAALSVLGYVPVLRFADDASFGVLEGEKASSDPGGEFWIHKGTPTAPLAHFAFSATSREAVHAFHAAAIAAGGTNNGDPGLRPHYHDLYYAAFIRDPDGYGIEAVYHRAK